MVLNLMIGLLHPPMGMVLFVLARVARCRSRRRRWQSCRGSFRCCSRSSCITYVPQISLWLPHVFYK
jgi:TRAP-type C4-dicarboxylate transport system permease large subunit